MLTRDVGGFIGEYEIVAVGDFHQILRTPGGRYSIIDADTQDTVRSNIRDLQTAKEYLEEIEVGLPANYIMDGWFTKGELDPQVHRLLRERGVTLKLLERMDPDDAEIIVGEIEHKLRQTKSRKRWPAIDEIKKALHTMGKSIEDIDKLTPDELAIVMRHAKGDVIGIRDKGFTVLGRIGADKAIYSSPKGRYVIEDLPTLRNIKSGLSEEQLHRHLDAQPEDYGYQMQFPIDVLQRDKRRRRR